MIDFILIFKMEAQSTIKVNQKIKNKPNFSCSASSATVSNSSHALEMSQEDMINEQICEKQREVDQLLKRIKHDYNYLKELNDIQNPSEAILQHIQSQKKSMQAKQDELIKARKEVNDLYEQKKKNKPAQMQRNLIRVKPREFQSEVQLRNTRILMSLDKNEKKRSMFDI